MSGSTWPPASPRTSSISARRPCTCSSSRVELLEISRLVGVESLSAKDRLILESARSIREDFLHQNAFHPQDTYTSLRKQYLMLRAILRFHRAAVKAVEDGVELDKVLGLAEREGIAKMKFLPEDEARLGEAPAALEAALAKLLRGRN